MGFKPTTPCGASDFETGCNPQDFAGKTRVSGSVGAELVAVEAESVLPADPDLAVIFDAGHPFRRPSGRASWQW